MEAILAEFWFYLGAALAFGIGMGCGSYATMPYYRLPNGITSAGKWIGKKSACPKCDAQLRTRDLVPVFNRLWHRGKCFSCGAHIPVIYWWIEFLSATAALWCYIRFGFTPEFLTTYGVIVCLVTLLATEITYRVLPKALLVAAVLFGAFALDHALLFDHIHVFFTGVIVCVAYVAAFEKINGEGSFARYDVLQLTCIAALWMPLLPYLLFVAAMYVVATVIMLVAKLRQSTNPAPYGLAPVLCLASYLLFF